MARRYRPFPIVLETYRECLQDVFDLPALKRLLQRHRDAASSTSSRSRRRPPRRIAASLLFDYVATYMYEDDTPPAERRAQALSLDRDLLRELLGQEELRELLDADALAEVEEQLARRAAERRRLHDLLLLRGDLRAGEYDQALAAPLAARAARRPIVRVGGRASG